MKPIDSTILAACIQSARRPGPCNSMYADRLARDAFVIYDAIMAESNRRNGATE
jgi:hypothetical protein